MTISTSTNRYSYIGNGVTTNFAYNSRFLADGDLVVLLVTIATGAFITKVLNTDYTISGAGLAGGGTITMIVAPASTESLVIYGDPEIVQATDWVENDPDSAEVKETAFDKLTLISARNRDLLTRSVTLSDSDTSGADLTLPTPEALSVIGWNSAGDGLENFTSISADSESIIYLPSGSGAVETTAGAKLKEDKTFIDKGAVGDGTTDNLTAFTNALSDYTGKLIRVPAGSYKIPFTAVTALSIGAGTVIEGDGKDNTTLTFVPSSTVYRNLFSLGGSGITFRNLKITCACPAGGEFALFLANLGSNVTFENCDFDGAVTNSGASISHTAYLVNYGSTGTHTDFDFIGCDIHRWSYAVLKTNASTSTERRLTYAHCDFYNNYYEDLGFNSPNGVMDDIQVYMCKFRDGNGASASLNQLYCAFASCTNFRVGGCSFEGAIGVAGNAVHIEENCIGGTVSANDFNVSGYAVQVSGNHNVSGAAITQPQSITITGNSIVKYGTLKESGSIAIGLVYNAALDQPTKKIVISDNTIQGYATGYFSAASLDYSSSVTDNQISGCAIGMNFVNGALTTSGNTTENCDVGISGSGGTNFDGATIDNHTFINCTTNVDSVDNPVTLLNPKFVFPLFNHAGGSTSVYKACLPTNAGDRFHGFMEITEDCDATASHAKRRDEVTWDGTTFTRTNKMTIQPGPINIDSVNNSTALSVQVFASSSRNNVRIQAKLNGMAVIAV